jgi:hypothetical protein
MSGSGLLKRIKLGSAKTIQGENKMSEFTFLFRGRDTNASPEQMQKIMEKWVAWFKDLGAKGHLKEPGHPLELGGKVVRGSQKTVTDGPYAEAKDVVGGFTVIEATDLAQAAELAKGCPILEAGGSVEVRPIQKMNM